jgi:hypothetical protein
MGTHSANGVALPGSLLSLLHWRQVSAYGADKKKTTPTKIQRHLYRMPDEWNAPIPLMSPISMNQIVEEVVPLHFSRNLSVKELP